MVDAIEVGAGCRNRWPGDVATAFAALLVGGVLHLSMLEESGQQGSLVNTLPVQRGFRNEKMKQRIVACGNGTPEARLTRPFGFAIGKMAGLLKQMLRQWHRGLGPCRVVHL